MVYELAVADRAFQDRLVQGFYIGNEGWLWTARRFAVSLDVPPPREKVAYLELDFSAPSELMKSVHMVNVTARVNGREVGRHLYKAEGRYHMTLPVSAPLLKQTPALVEFELDKAAKDPAGREVGLIVVSVSLRRPEETVIDREAATSLARQSYLRLLQQRRAKLPVEKQNDLMKLFHDLPVWRELWFQNVQIEKNPLDLWMMQQIIYEVQPDFVIETGTWRGGSALYWAYTLHGMGLENSRVLTVDIQELTTTAVGHPLWKKYVTFFKGSSTDPAIVAEIARSVGGRKTVIALDSDHSMRHVLDELRAYSPLVSRGSYVVVEDTHMDGVPTQPGFGPGPMAAVLQFLREGGSKNFEQDLSREALLMTFNPGGWLRRK